MGNSNVGTWGESGRVGMRGWTAAVSQKATLQRQRLAMYNAKM